MTVPVPQGGPSSPTPESPTPGSPAPDPRTGAPDPHLGSGDSPLDRAAALNAGPPGIPLKFVYWVVAVVAVLSLGGLIGEHLFSSAGLNPTAKAHKTTTPAPVRTGPSVRGGARPVDASLSSMMGLTDLGARPAPPFSLVDQDGQTTALPWQPPSVVVLTFFSGRCNDICPVLAAEIRQADRDLGTLASRVEFLTVNTDPLALSVADQSAVLSDTGLGALPNWRMLTGPLTTLDSVWKAYGVSISVVPKTGLQAHNELLYFIDPRGDLRYRATPFANEKSSTGTYSLPPSSISRWGEGIATYAGRLVP